MKQYNIDPNEPQTFTVQRAINVFAPDEYLPHIYEELKRDAGLELYGILEQMKSPVVVEIKEILPDQQRILYARKYNFETLLFAEVSIHLTPVKYRDIVFERHHISPDKYAYKSKSMVQKIKNLRFLRLKYK